MKSGNTRLHPRGAVGMKMAAEPVGTRDAGDFGFRNMPFFGVKVPVFRVEKRHVSPCNSAPSCRKKTVFLLFGCAGCQQVAVLCVADGHA